MDSERASEAVDKVETKASSGRSRFWFRLAVAWVVIIVGLFGGAELFVRYVLKFPVTPADVTQRVFSIVGLGSINETFACDDALFWKLKPGLKNVEVKGKLFDYPIEFHVTTDAEGRRIVPSTTREGEGVLRVLALGDSCTFGFGVDDKDSWPAQLQALLDLGGGGRRFRVINFGVPGYSSYQCVEHFKREGLALRPNLVIAQFWMNDQVAWGWGDRLAAAQLNPPLWLRLLQKSHFWHFVQRTVADYRTPDRPRALPEEFRATAAELAGLCKENGIPLMFVVWPSDGAFKDGKHEPYAAALKEYGTEAGIPVVDVFEEIKGKPGQWFLDPCHATREGNATTARLLEPEVLRLCK